MERIHGAIFPGLLTAVSATGETPSFENDYGRAEIGHPWETMLVGEGLDGWNASEGPFTPSVWRREGDAILADTGQASRGRLIQGDGTWAAYEFKVQATIEKGFAGPQLVFGTSDDGNSSYFLTYLGRRRPGGLGKQLCSPVPRPEDQALLQAITAATTCRLTP